MSLVCICFPASEMGEEVRLREGSIFWRRPSWESRPGAWRMDAPVKPIVH